MKQSYKDLPDAEKLSLAIEFKAYSYPLPEALQKFLQHNNLLDIVNHPPKDYNE